MELKEVTFITWHRQAQETTCSGKLWSLTSLPTALSVFQRVVNSNRTLECCTRKTIPLALMDPSPVVVALDLKAKSSNSQARSLALAVCFNSPKRFQAKRKSTSALIWLSWSTCPQLSHLLCLRSSARDAEVFVVTEASAETESVSADPVGKASSVTRRKKALLLSLSGSSLSPWS